MADEYLDEFDEKELHGRQAVDIVLNTMRLRRIDPGEVDLFCYVGAVKRAEEILARPHINQKFENCFCQEVEDILANGSYVLRLSRGFKRGRWRHVKVVK